jgi:hypothetical protein
MDKLNQMRLIFGRGAARCAPTCDEFFFGYPLGFIESIQYEKLNSDLIEVKRRLNAFIQKLKANR